MGWLDRLHHSVYTPVDSCMVDLHSQQIGVILINGADLQKLEGTENDMKEHPLLFTLVLYHMCARTHAHTHTHRLP